MIGAFSAQYSAMRTIDDNTSLYQLFRFGVSCHDRCHPSYPNKHQTQLLLFSFFIGCKLLSFLLNIFLEKPRCISDEDSTQKMSDGKSTLHYQVESNALIKLKSSQKMRVPLTFRSLWSFFFMFEVLLV